MDSKITKDIIDHIENNGGKPSNWYIGIAADARTRLFSDHNVREKGDAWIFREAANHETARSTEKHLLEKLGTKGGQGGGDEKTKYVYAYKIQAHTKE